MNQVSVQTTQTQHCKSTLSQYKIKLNLNRKEKKRKEKKSQWYSPQVSVTWAGITPLEPEQTCVSRLDCGGAEGPREDGPANEAPLHLKSQVPWGWDHHLQIQAGRRTAQPSRVHPKPGGLFGWKSFEKSPSLHVSWWWVPSGSLLPRNPRLPTTASSELSCGQVLGFSWGWRLKGRSNETPALSCFFWHIPPLPNPGTRLSLWLSLPQ